MSVKSIVTVPVGRSRMRNPLLSGRQMHSPSAYNRIPSSISQEAVFYLVEGTSRAYCHQRLAVSPGKVGELSTGMIGRTGAIVCEGANSFLGKGMVPKSQKWQTFPTN